MSSAVDIVKQGIEAALSLTSPKRDLMNILGDKYGVDESDYIIIDGERFPFAVIKAFGDDNVIEINKTYDRREYVFALNRDVTPFERVKLYEYTREHYPITSMLIRERKIIEDVFIQSSLVLSNHTSSRERWTKSFKQRDIEHPNVLVEYTSSVGSVGSSGGSSSNPLCDAENRLRDHMRASSYRSYMPDPELVDTNDYHESTSLTEILEKNVKYAKKFLDISDVISTLAETPEYHQTFTHFKNVHLLGKDTSYINARVFESMKGLEDISVAKKEVICTEDPFVFRLDNPLCALTDVTPEQQNKILSYVTFGISDMIDYSKGAYLSGSMISAAIQFIKNRDIFLLESNYPRVYTNFEGDSEAYHILRAYLYGLIDSPNARLHIERIEGDTITASFSFGEVADRRFRDHHLYYNGGFLDIPEEITRKSREFAAKGVSGTYMFKLVPGCDIDVPVNSSNPNNIKLVAVDLLEKMNAKWPGSVLEIVTENRQTPMYRITTRSIENRLRGFRDVEIYPSSDPISQIASYHVNAVRAWKGGEPGIYLTASAVLGHSFMETTNHRYFSGKDKPWLVVDKYATRGFRVRMWKYANLRREVGKYDLDPSHDTRFINTTSSVGMYGKFSILAHNIRNEESVSFSDRDAYAYPQCEEWETTEERRSRLIAQRHSRSD